MKNKTVYIISFSIIGAGAYFIYKYSQKRKAGQSLSYSDSVKEDTKAVANAVTNAVLPLASFPLKKGSKGSNVVTLQKWLNDKGYASPKLVTDGDFGTKTENVVKAMQNNPYEKTIVDYLDSAKWSSPYVKGQVTEQFYDIFIIKTKSNPNSTSNIWGSIGL
jgi:hypothetical protein